MSGAPLWAEAGYDDSKWESVDLAPEAGVFDKGQPANAGWSKGRHEQYFGWGWYRIRVAVQTQPAQPLAVAELASVDDAFQFFVNGNLVGSFGKFRPEQRTPEIFAFPRPAVFRLPGGTEKGESAQVRIYTLAFRVWRGPTSYLRGETAGGIRGGPILGAADAVATQVRLESSILLRVAAYAPFELAFLSLLAILVLGQRLFDRSDPVYSWVAAMLMITALYDLTWILENIHRLSLSRQLLIDDVILDPLLLGGWAMVWWKWFRFQRPRWVPRAIVGMAVLHIAARLLQDSYMMRDTVSLAHEPLFQNIAMGVRLLCLALLLYVVFLGIRKHGGEGWIVLPSAMLIAPQQFTGELAHLGIRILWVPHGVIIFIGYIANFFLVFAIMLLLLRRLLLSIRRQKQMALDIKQAQEVQQVLIPDAIPEIPGLQIESVYLPAGEVGGDFFQIVRTSKGAALVCIGDVSGKGLPAAMTVALLVGTFRTLAYYTQSPGAILEAMNTRMLGRSRGGFTTCLVLRADPDGGLTIANAGHILPYIRGKEIPIENGLPLGLVASAEYRETMIRLEEMERLTVVTDGVVEARSPAGELFGFDRTAEITKESAQTIADSAKEFGQEDDITVLTLTRAGVRATTSDIGLREFSSETA